MIQVWGGLLVAHRLAKSNHADAEKRKRADLYRAQTRW
jgi:hypothetical protein